MFLWLLFLKTAVLGLGAAHRRPPFALRFLFPGTYCSLFASIGVAGCIDLFLDTRGFLDSPQWIA